MIAIGAMELHEKIVMTLLCCGPLFGLLLTIPFMQKKLKNPWVKAILSIYIFVLGYYGRQMLKNGNEKSKERLLRQHMKQVEQFQKQEEDRQNRINK